MIGIMQLSIYAGWHIVHEHSFLEGLRVAFFESYADQAKHKAKAMQDELHAVAASDRIIHQHLKNVLDRFPGTSRVRLAVIHNGISGLTGVGMLRFDVIHGVAAPGRDIGIMVANQPLSEWIDYLGTLLTGQCAFVNSVAVHPLSARIRMEELGMQAFLVCPTVNAQNMTLGAVFASWDKNDTLPSAELLTTMMTEMKSTASQVAVALDMRTGPEDAR